MKLLQTTVVILISFMSLIAQKTMQCQKYKIEGNRKTEWTTFNLTFSADQKQVVYQKVSGPEWHFPTGTSMDVMWKSKDGLRVVAYWVEKKYEHDPKKWSPVYIFDIDYKKPYLKDQTLGGFADFDEVVHSPWNYEFIRLD